MAYASYSETQFGDSGYLHARSVLDSGVIAEVLELLQASKEHLGRRFEEWIGEPVNDHPAFAFHQARRPEYESRGLPKDLSHYLRGEFDLETRMNPKICAILGSGQACATLVRLFGRPKFYVHYPPMVRFKIADAPGSILPPHQDFTYNGHLRDFLTVWVPLTDIDDEVGGLVMHSGSHRIGRLDHSPSGPWEHGLKEQVAPQYAKETVHMQVGDALIFPPLLIHESAPHRSKTRLRYSIDFRVFGAPEDTTKSFFDPFEKRVVRQH